MKTNKMLLAAGLALLAVTGFAKDWPGFSCGMGIGGWLTNYKRFNVLKQEWRLPITIGDLEHFDTYITERDIANIKVMGFDHIRLGFDQIVLEERPGVYRERTFRKIDDFIGWCGNHGLNVVLNLHKAVGNYCDIPEKVSLLDDAGLQKRFVDLWLEIERRYHDFPGLAFELLNEVRDIDPEKWNELADRTLKAIRVQNPDRWVVIGSTCWNSAGKLKDLKIWDDPHVVYTFHMYTPHVFTHQRGVLQDGPLYYNRTMEYPTTDVERYRDFNRLLDPKGDGGYKGVTAIDRAYLKGCLAGAIAFAKEHPDKILWNGEFGTIRHAPKASRVAYMRDIVSICKEAGIPWCVWNYLSTPNDGNRFSLVDDDTRRILSQELLNACLGKEDGPKEVVSVSGEAPSLLPAGKRLKLIWNDEFNGTALDTSKWSYRTNFWGRRAPWFAAPEDGTVEVKDGKVHLKIKKLPNGQFVSPQLQTGELMWDISWDEKRKGFFPLPKREKPKFVHRYGYYECRFRLQRKKGWWSAFWMQTEQQGCTVDPAVSGVEHDILESFNPGEIIAHCFHANGYSHDYLGFKTPRVKNAFEASAVVKVGTDDFHTIGMLWEPDGYTVYIDGVQHGPKVGEGAGEAVSHIPEFVLLTTECHPYREDRMTRQPDAALRKTLDEAVSAGDAFVVDFVRVYDLEK